MFLVGVTGGIATGKTLACNFFKKKNIEIVDADEISRSLQEIGQKGYVEVIKAFGDEVLKPNKELDKAKLRKIIFSDQKKKDELEGIMHPIIGEKTLEDVAKIKSKWGVYSAPIWGKYDNFNRTLVIDAPEKTQIERIIKRDNVGEEEAKIIIDKQMSRHSRISFATDFILNDSSIEDFERKLEFYFNFFESQL
ncbi:dephospho-CoA kinase [SAR86 cluster bacterium]|jgi:dephospho-CoA kinase|uniref:Dephospho-CoA kinase n=1 Tax=SAR86 cluster bacterium TaxID=2030880 RepID=A0A9Q8TYL1_9GAMM|nr:dephospho-CoA kinase [SAR86 cluster bacterium]